MIIGTMERKIFKYSLWCLIVLCTIYLVCLWSTAILPSTATPSGVQKVAYAISVTKEGLNNDFLDGAAVVAYTAMRNSRHDLSKYDVSLIAFVLPGVMEVRTALQKLGYLVIETRIPINTDAINPSFTFMKENILTNGCCGAAELIKLESYRMTEFDFVVHLDVDAYIRKPFDSLFESMPESMSIMATTDPGMQSKVGTLPWQGGFLVIRPSNERYKDIISTFMKSEFRSGAGWDNSNIGWFYGGMTIQGFLPFYYQYVVASTTGLYKLLDRCVYNSMADSKECKDLGSDPVVSFHFTVCQKPWTHGCNPPPVPECQAAHKEWAEMRAKAENFHGLPQSNACNSNNQYQPLDLMRIPNFIKHPDILMTQPIAEALYTSGSIQT